jgi:hypothetical protein
MGITKEVWKGIKSKYDHLGYVTWSSLEVQIIDFQSAGRNMKDTSMNTSLWDMITEWLF